MTDARILLLALLGAVCVTSLPKNEFYPFGQDQEDDKLPVADDLSTDEIQLKTPIAFYEDIFYGVYINLNGLITFRTDLPNFKSDLILPIGLRSIAPYFSDIDTRLSGNVYYRETEDPSLLDKAAKDVLEHFPDRASGFRPTHLFIVTWDEVGYYRERYDQTNTFQVVIASDGFDSYCFLFYADNGLNWVQSEGKQSPLNPDVPAQVGFDAGDNNRYYTLPGSGQYEVQSLSQWTNMDKAGAWIFRIGDTRGENIEAPEEKQEGGRARGDQPSRGNPTTCANGGTDTCDANARCNDYPTGFCCECNSGFIGNGKNCIAEGEPQRVNGKVTGNINGEVIDSVDLHSYVVTSDGRTYTAISRIPIPNGYAMQSLFTVGGILGWLFAAPHDPRSQNGYMITGGDFNRSVSVKYLSGGESVNIKQQFTGQDVLGYLRVNTNINGNIPGIAATAKVEVADFNEEYRRVAPGIIKSNARMSYTVDGSPQQFTVDQTITFNECGARPLDGLQNQKLHVTRNFVVFGESEQIVRYAMTNAISGAGADPCEAANLVCDPKASCAPHGGSHRCVCNEGYEGDGSYCRDADECQSRTHDCDLNAACVNTEGGFRCQCQSGYTGDGKTCTRDNRCGDYQVCADNARCVFDPEQGSPRCECDPGFTGDGESCDAAGNTCDVLDNCDPSAQCVYDGASRGYICQCNQGYTGDGYQCQQTQQPGKICTAQSDCDFNARCTPTVRRTYECICNPGFTGDGFSCTGEGGQPSCNVQNFCDRNAQCIYDYDLGDYACKCNEGFDGDGTSCREAETSCNVVNNCDINADCIYDYGTAAYVCQCREGYSGSGLTCTHAIDCRRDPSICSRFARCERVGTQSTCVCAPGYKGDGTSCAPIGDTSSFLMYNQGVSIMQVPFNPTDADPGKQTLLIPGQTAIGIDVDCYERYFYWTDVSGKTISRAKLDGTDSSVLVRHLGSPEGVAVDWVSRNMYWADSGLDTIEVAKLDGTKRKTLFDDDLVNPRAIVVDPSNGVMFWSDWNRDAPKIVKANMDGTYRQTIVSDNLGLPNGLTIDFETQNICWADAGTSHIECSNYDGRGRRAIYNGANYPFGLTLHENIFYWTDWDMRSVANMNQFSNEPNPALQLPLGGNGKLYGITAVRSQCPRGTNACSLNNGGCRFLCLPTPNGGRTCACPGDIDEQECNRITLL